MLSDVYPDRSGTAIGVASAAGNVGTTSLPAIGGVVAAAVGRRLGFGLVVPLLLATAVGLWSVVPRRTAVPADGSPGDGEDSVERALGTEPPTSFSGRCWPVCQRGECSA